jgi:hypothetical protein
MGQFTIGLIALAVMFVAITLIAPALNAIVQSETESQRHNLTYGSAKAGGSAPSYGIVHVAMPKGKKAFPIELVPVP